MAVKAPNIPSWQWSQLTTLASENDLSGASAEDIGLIDQAESSGSGGGINSEGYGGWFGLGENSSYTSPTGQTFTDTPGLLTETSTTAYDQQAETAAAEFSSLLEKYGNPIEAEQAYQTGSPQGVGEGAQIFESAGDTGDLSQAQLQALNASGNDSTVLTSATSGTSTASATLAPVATGASGIFQEINDLLNPSGGSLLTQLATLGTSDIVAVVETIFVRGLFAVGFLLLTYAGVKGLGGSSGGGGSTAILEPLNAYNRTQNTQTARGRLDLDRQREERIANPSPVSSTSSSTPPASEVYRKANPSSGSATAATHRAKGGAVVKAEEAIAL